MPVSAARAACRITMIAGVAAMLAACADDSGHWGGQPLDSTLIGPAMTPGGSGLGNYLAALHAHAHHQGGAAADFYSVALKTDPDNVELLQRAFALMAAEGRMAEAGDIARRLVNFDPNASVATLFLAMQEVKAGSFDAAERRLAALPQRGINVFVAPLSTAWIRVGQRRVDEALQALSPLADNSHLAPLHDFHAALIADLAGRDTVAAEYYRSAVASPGGMTVRAVQAAGSFHQRRGRPERAAEVYGAYTRLHPDSALFDAQARLAAGRDVARPVDSVLDGLAEVMFGAASTVRQANAAEAALVFTRMALDLRPDFPLAQVVLADILQNQGRLADANAVYAAIRPEGQLWWSVSQRMAANMDELGDVDGAAELLRALAAKAPERPEPLLTLGELLRKRERFAEAVEAYDAALARIGAPESRHWTLFYSRGISLERSKQWPRAESDFLKALELEPDQPFVLNYLGYSWVEQGVNLDDARRMIEKAVELRPGDGYIVDSLGWVLYRLGEYERAVLHLERAVELRPQDATINDHLGDALWRVGRVDEARYHWQRALGLTKDQELRSTIGTKLAAGLAEQTTAEPKR